MAKAKRVAIIPPAEQYDRGIRVEQKALRVAAYCRVSTLMEQQESSYEAQIEYYKNMINENSNWKLVKIYADEGKSATQMDKRDEFNALIEDCKKGKIDLVLTKSVSRFARNTVHSLQAIRTLKEHGVPVIFEKENINTMDATGELLLTILSSQAQEESRNISENTQWGVVRRFENGEAIVNHNKFLGYTRDKEGNLVIVPEEAVIVKRIYREYLEGKSLLEISRGLEKDGIKTVTGKEKWHPSVLDRILSNEKHCGDLLLQKTVTVDYLTHKRQKNKGQVKQYYIEDNHEAIIPKALFHQVQAEKLKRSSLHKSSVAKRRKKEEQQKAKFSSKYLLSGILVCGESGHNYRRQTWSKYGVKHAVWRCEDRLKNGAKSKCQHSPTIKEVELHNAIMKAINSIVEDGDDYVETFRENVIRVIGAYAGDGKIKEYEEQIEELQKQMLQIISDNSKDGRIKENFMDECNKIDEQIKSLKTAKIKAIKGYKEQQELERKIEKVDQTLKDISHKVYEFDEELVRRLISKITVKRNEWVEIQFYSGIVANEKI